MKNSKFVVCLVVYAALLCTIVVYNKYFITLVCLGITAVQIIASIVATVTQYDSVQHQRRLTANAIDIIAGWCLVGILPALAFGYAQWSYLISSPWTQLFPSSVAFGIAYLFIYWNWLYRLVTKHTEGRDYVLATRGL